MTDSRNGKWSVAFWVMSTLVAGSFIWTTFCFFNNGDKITALTNVANHSLSAIDKSMNSIDLRLSKIEWQLSPKQ